MSDDEVGWLGDGKKSVVKLSMSSVIKKIGEDLGVCTQNGRLAG